MLMEINIMPYESSIQLISKSEQEVSSI